MTSQNILISNFDGTMTQHDFCQSAVEALLPPGMPGFWIDYRVVSIKHFEELRR